MAVWHRIRKTGEEMMLMWKMLLLGQNNSSRSNAFAFRLNQVSIHPYGAIL